MVFLGSLLIFLGVFWLLKNLGLIPGDIWDIFWPIVLILIGARILWPGKWHRLWENIDGKKIKIE